MDLSKPTPIITSISLTEDEFMFIAKVKARSRAMGRKTDMRNIVSEALALYRREWEKKNTSA